MCACTGTYLINETRVKVAVVVDTAQIGTKLGFGKVYLLQGQVGEALIMLHTLTNSLCKSVFNMMSA